MADIKELEYKGQNLNLEKMVEDMKSKNSTAKLVGYQVHFLVEFDGQETLASIGGFSKNFDIDNYGS